MSSTALRTAEAHVDDLRKTILALTVALLLLLILVAWVSWVRCRTFHDKWGGLNIECRVKP